MAKKGSSRKGSLQFSPRKRAAKMLPRVRSWPDAAGLQGFVGYKVGMVTVFVKTTNPKSPFSGKKIVKAATVIEVPPMILRNIRTYKKTEYGAKIIKDSKTPKVEGVDFARLIFETQPKLAGTPKKTFETVEIGFGGSVEDVVKFASEHMDKEVKFSEVFSVSEFIDVTGVSIGRGLQGPVKRMGVKLQFSKTEKATRKVGSLGPWNPERTDWRVAMAGQTGFHTRTEYNKQILKIGEPINTDCGWKKYGVTKSDCVLVLGTVVGAKKRSLKLRKPIRANSKTFAVELQNIIKNGKVSKE